MHNENLNKVFLPLGYQQLIMKKLDQSKIRSKGLTLKQEKEKSPSMWSHESNFLPCDS